MLFNKIAVINLIGGLGNQLFQIAFADYLLDNGFDVNMKTNWYKDHDFNDGTTKRDLEINVNDFRHKIADPKIIRKFDKLEKAKDVFLLDRLYKSRINTYYKVHTGNIFDEKKIYINNYFEGYWQSTQYLKNKKKFLLDGLNKNPAFKEEYTKNNISTKTLIHIRKGDYVNWKQDLSLNYFHNGIEKIKSRTQDFKYDIYTDEQTNFSDKIYSSADNIFNDLNESPIRTLAKMTKYKSYIISNSSFSFFSAFLSKTKNPIVFYPDPWFKETNHGINNNLNWEALENN